MKKKSTKKRMGRPPLPPEKRRVQRDFTLPAEVIRMAEKIGGGNASAGVEKAVLAYYEKVTA